MITFGITRPGKNKDCKIFASYLENITPDPLVSGQTWHFLGNSEATLSDFIFCLRNELAANASWVYGGQK
jgi:hypothetical protein